MEIGPYGVGLKLTYFLSMPVKLVVYLKGKLIQIYINSINPLNFKLPEHG